MSSNIIFVHGDDVLDAWIKASRAVFDARKIFNLNVSIKSSRIPLNREIIEYDPRRVSSSVMGVLDVANTIFPKPSGKWDIPVADFCRYYEPRYIKLLKATPHSWGMYFLRLISYGDVGVNQLATVIKGLEKWGKGHHAAFNFHFSSMEMDKPRPLGAPCLQYCQLGASGEGSLSMTVVYRSHDYFQKALGNFLGLGRMLNYICHHVDMKPGSIHCLSTYAHYQGTTKKKFNELLRLP